MPIEAALLRLRSTALNITVGQALAVPVEAALAQSPGAVLNIPAEVLSFLCRSGWSSAICPTRRLISWLGAAFDVPVKRQVQQGCRQHPGSTEQHRKAMITGGHMLPVEVLAALREQPGAHQDCSREVLGEQRRVHWH